MQVAEQNVAVAESAS